MDIININRNAVLNLTDEEITSFCSFKTVDYKLDGAQFIINELARRLETANDLNDSLIEDVNILQDSVQSRL